MRRSGQAYWVNGEPRGAAADAVVTEGRQADRPWSSRPARQLDRRRSRNAARVLAYYHGFSLRDRSAFQPVGWPDEVVLLAGPISRFATASGRDVREIIRICLIHELAHLVGLTHARMRELGYTFDAPTKDD